MASVLLLGTLTSQDKTATQEQKVESTAAIKKEHDRAVKAFMDAYMNRAKSGASRAELEQMMRKNPSEGFSVDSCLQSRPYVLSPNPSTADSRTVIELPVRA